MSMFCYQCEQTARGTGCTAKGVCGKDQETAQLQDLLIYGLKGLSMYAHRARQLGASDPEINVFTLEALFTTVTNVNFDARRVAGMVERLGKYIEKAKISYENACKKANVTPDKLQGPAIWRPAKSQPDMLKQIQDIGGIDRRKKDKGDDLTGLQELLTYGLKGMAAYADHAQILGQEDESVYAFMHEALDFMTRESSIGDYVSMNLTAGAVNLKVMELLDTGHTKRFGHPVPTPVRIHPVQGKAILISGHDLTDLEYLLKQTEGKGINIYTHGEMLPAHGYPGLKKYKHLVGNYGGAWQDQQKEFDKFPGAILMTTNCIQAPKDTYKNRIFTSGLVAWPGVKHIERSHKGQPDFSSVITAALDAKGFSEDGPADMITVGFGHNAVLGVAGAVVEAVKSGAIKHFFLVGGCDGAKPGRNYYTELAESIPKDCVILTLACGKFRFNKLDLGSIGGIPRLLDVGQCNDAYSAIVIADALAKAFGTDVNGLPLSLILSWYEQKAVVILLSLLHLGIKNIRLGPSLPAFVTPPVLEVLVREFGIKPISTPKEDLKAILG